MPEPKRRQLHFATFADAYKDIDALATAEREGRLTRHGNWTLGQAINHVAAWAEFAFTGPPVPTPPFFIRWPMRLLRGTILRKGFPAGVRMRGVEGGTVATEIVDTDQAFARLRAAFEHLDRETPSTPNKIFGRLSNDQWKQLQLRHAELHLSFFGMN